MNTQRGPMPGTCVSRTVTRHDTRPRPHTCEVAKSDCGHWRWSLSLRHSARTTDSKGDEAIGFMSGWGRHRARAVRILLKPSNRSHGTRDSRDAGLSKGTRVYSFYPPVFSSDHNRTTPVLREAPRAGPRGHADRGERRRDRTPDGSQCALPLIDLSDHCVG
jgi:hypothetical protein